jgi:hypothetical protein
VYESIIANDSLVACWRRVPELFLLKTKASGGTPSTQKKKKTHTHHFFPKENEMRYFGGCRPIQAVFLASLRFAWRPLRAAVLYQASNRIVPYGAFTSNPLRPSQASLSVRLGILIHRGGASRLIAPVASDPETRAWCGGALDLENGSTRSQFGYIFIILVYLSWAAATNVPVTLHVYLSCLFLGLFFSYICFLRFFFSKPRRLGFCGLVSLSA